MSLKNCEKTIEERMFREFNKFFESACLYGSIEIVVSNGINIIFFIYAKVFLKTVMRKIQMPK